MTQVVELTVAMTHGALRYVARRLDVDVTSQSNTVGEALGLYFERKNLPYSQKPPILIARLDSSQALHPEHRMGHGIGSATRTIETFGQYCHEQGRASRALAPREVSSHAKWS
ncbi:MAG TPA: hypothetical protein VMU99_01320 [Acidimicrobiales bacterium]|nr:hypothetical protein [Acidimicrobiales bacterium]